jgi:hypothetical protein
MEKSQQTMINRILDMISKQPDISRRELSRRIYEWMNWPSPKGNLQDMSCREALFELDNRCVISLPGKAVFTLSRRELGVISGWRVQYSAREPKGSS